MNTIDGIGYGLVDFLILASVVLATVWAASRWIKQPVRRLAVDWAAAAALCLMAATSFMPGWPRLSLHRQIAAPIAANDSIAARAPVGQVERTAPQATASGSQERFSPRLQGTEAAEPTANRQPATQAIADTGAIALSRSSSSLRMIGVVVAFAAGALATAFWLLLGAWRTAMIIRRAQAAPEPIQQVLSRLAGSGARVPRLLITPDLHSAAAVGLWKPVILLPNRMTGDERPGELESILKHELAHIRNLDLWLLAVGRGLSLLLFAHPLYWRWRQAMRDDQELVADAAAIGPMGATAYAECLLQWAREALAAPRRSQAAGQLGIWQHPSRLARRIEVLLDERIVVEAACPAKWSRGALTLLALTAVALSILTVRPVSLARAGAPAGDRKVTHNGVEDSASTALAAAPQSEPPPQAAAPGEGRFQISGVVVGPDRAPLGGAKVYAIFAGDDYRLPRLKDPNQKLFELKQDANGVELVEYVYPKAVEILKKHGFGPVITMTIDTDPRLKFPELAQELLDLYPEVYASHPIMVPPVRATTDEQGRFRFDIADAERHAPLESDLSIVAVLGGYGPAWTTSHEKGSFSNIALQLAKDSLPIHGRILDDHGRPVSGAKVEMGDVQAGLQGTADPWIELVRKFPDSHDKLMGQMTSFPGYRLRLFPDNTLTNGEGRFTIAGVGADRLVWNLQVSAPGLAKDAFTVMTRPEGIEVDPARRMRAAYRTYGADFTHTLQPSKPWEGTVRSGGKPLVGVRVYGGRGSTGAATDTDAEGKFRLDGLPQTGERLQMSVSPGSANDQLRPYLYMTKYVDAEPANGLRKVDFDLVPGVIARGRVVDRRTGEPIARSTVFYAGSQENPRAASYFFRGNPRFPDVPGDQPPLGAPVLFPAASTTLPDGSFQIVVLPGRGVLAVGLDDDNRAGWKSVEPALKQLGATVPDLTWMWLKGLQAIDVPEGKSEWTVDLELESIP